MKLGYSNSLYPESLEAACARAAACGYDGLEMLVDSATLAASHQVRSLLDEHGLSLAAGAALMTSDREIIHPDPGVRAAAISYLEAAVEFVGTLGGSVLTIAPGADGRLSPWSTAEEERAWCIEGLRAVQKLGDRQNVRVGIEPVCRFETYYVNRALEALSIAEDVGPNCGVVLDVFHMYLEEHDPLDAIDSMSGRLVNFHVAEHNRLPPGFGVVPWDDVIARLIGAQYDGYLTLEFDAPEAWSASGELEDPYSAAVGKAVQVLRSCTSRTG